MKPKLLLMTLLAAMLVTGPVLRAQTASELLQRGIYMQETMGDLDGAIKLYRQVTQMSKDSRVNAAQAQYRLGLCLQKKGQPGEAGKVLQELIDQYPDQADVVGKARALVASSQNAALLPAPWVDGEILQMKMSTVNGKSVGSLRYSIQTSKTSPDHWEMETRTNNIGMSFRTRVEADKENMKPVTGDWFGLAMLGGDVHIAYRDGEARVEKTGKDAKVIPLDGIAWDNEEVWAVMRRMPLAPGYKTSLQIVSPAGIVVKLGLAVTGMADVTTPAGTFHCFRVELDTVNQTYFYSADASRYPVKYEVSGMVSVELQSVGRVGAQTATSYHNEKMGYSLGLPAGWTADVLDSMGGKRSSVVQLVDPETMTTIMISADPMKEGSSPDSESRRKEVEIKIADQQDLKIRQDSWKDLQIGGHPALSWVADLTDPFNQKLVQYTVRVWSNQTSVDITAKAAPKDFEGLRPRLASIIDSLTIK